MKKTIYANYDELSVKTAELIAGIVSDKPGALLCFPAGETSLGTFRHLIELNRKGNISFKKCRIVGLDEWANLGSMKTENCFSFLKKHFFDHIDYSKENICFFDGETIDLQKECKRIDSFISSHGPIDMILLGTGMNGHLGLNEPGTSFNKCSHVVELDETTRKVGQKYFSGYVNLTRGITLGIRHIIEAKTMILQINGRTKAAIVKKLMENEVSPELPASLVKVHANSFLLLDREVVGLQ